MSVGSEEQRAVRVLALGEQIHLRSPLTLVVPNHPNQLGVQSPLSLRNPLPRKHVRPSDQETGDVRSSDEEENSPLPACTAPLSEFLSGDLYTKPQTCCRCKSVHAAVPAVAENPLELRRLLPAPGGLCATGSEITATVPKLAFPRTLHKRSGLRQSFDVAAMRKHWPRLDLARHKEYNSCNPCLAYVCA